MTDKEKAKAYDNALNWMRSVYPTMTGAFKEDAEHYFPELKESEDEMIRKAIFKALSKKDARDVLLANGIQVSDALAWLEKPKYTEKDLDKAYKCADEVQYRRGYEDAKKRLKSKVSRNLFGVKRMMRY